MLLWRWEVNGILRWGKTFLIFNTKPQCFLLFVIGTVLGVRYCSWLHHTDTSIQADTQWLRSQNRSRWKLFFIKFLWWLSFQLDPLASLTQLPKCQSWHTWEVLRKSDSWQKSDYGLAVTLLLVVSFPHWYQLITVVEPQAKCQAESSRFH